MMIFGRTLAAILLGVHMALLVFIIWTFWTVMASLIGSASAADLAQPRATFDQRFGEWHARAIWIWSPIPPTESSRYSVTSLAFTFRNTIEK